MGQLNRHVDMTGSQTVEDIQSTELGSIIDELNRTSDNLDALLNNLSIAGYGSISYTWDGVSIGATPITQNATITSSGALFPIVFMNRSDQPGNLYSLPYVITQVNANGDATMASYFYAGVNLGSQQFFVNLAFFAPGTPKTYTFYYYLMAQPPNATAH